MPTGLPRRASNDRRRRARLLPALVAALALALTAACGSSEPDDGPGATSDGPRVADPRFEGRFTVVELESGGRPVPLGPAPQLVFDSEFGGLTVETGCNTHFGALSLDEDGRASFTLTGRTDLGCGDLADQEAAVLAAVDAVDRWTGLDGGFRFEGGTSALVVEGPVG